MRVLLVQGWLEGREPPVYPLGLACLAAVLSGHEVRGFDPNVEGPAPMARLDALLAEFRPEVVGLSLRNLDAPSAEEVHSYYAGFRALAAHIKSRCPAPLIVGGAGFSLFAEQVMRDAPEADFGVFLEGERGFPALLANLDHPEAVPGIWHCAGGEPRFSGPLDPDADAPLPTPDRSRFPLAPYLGVTEPEALGVEGKRGCSLTCAYCPYGFLSGRKVRLKDPAAVAAEVLKLARAGARAFTFTDPVFNRPRAHAEAVCRALIEGGNTLPWSAWFHEIGLDRDLLELARRAGCRRVILSPDALDDAVLKTLGKTASVADIRAAVARIAAMQDTPDGPAPALSLSFFRNPPGQSLRTLLRLAAFCLNARRRMGRRVGFYFSRLRVEPHTALCRRALSEGLIHDESELLAPVFYAPPGSGWIDAAFELALRWRGRLGRRGQYAPRDGR